MGAFVEDEELLHIVLDGLPTEMYPFCTTMRTRNEPIGLEELHVLINAEEKSLKNNSDSSKESIQHLAMLGTGPKSGIGTGNCYNFRIANPSAGCREVIIYRKFECRTTEIDGTKNTGQMK